MSWLISKALMEAYESSHSSPELVEGYSEDNSSGGEPSAPLNVNPTPQAYLSPDRMTNFFRLSRFGMTFATLTDDLGQDVLTWYQADFPARTYPQQEKAQALKVTEAGSGWKWHESSVKYDHDMRSWKTRQYSLLADSEWFSETWPRWGTMRDGECWELPMSERRTSGTGSGLLPTPTCSDTSAGPSRMNGNFQRYRGLDLATYAQMWPTPRVQMARPVQIRQDIEKGHKSNLEEVVAISLMATPTARDWKSGKASQATHERNSRPLSEQIGGHLNPTWVEWLMGWPLAWTDLKPLEMDKSRNAPPKHGES